MALHSERKAKTDETETEIDRETQRQAGRAKERNRKKERRKRDRARCVQSHRETGPQETQTYTDTQTHIVTYLSIFLSSVTTCLAILSHNFLRMS